MYESSIVIPYFLASLLMHTEILHTYPKLSKYIHITEIELVCDGDPCVANARLGVKHVLALLQDGGTFEDVDAWWPGIVPREAIERNSEFGKEINFVSNQKRPK
jgi:uncharacterized protein (DUF433 family)